jgi:DNA-binding MarR family transcriptional regulator
MKLNDDEMHLWHAWKRASDVVRSRIAQDLADAVGLSDPDFSVLSRVSDAGGVLRQNELAASMDWHRSRLSHQLTRMEERGLVQRRTVPGGVQVLITASGRASLDAALPVHAAAVRKHLTNLVPHRRLRALAAELERIAQPNGT